MAGNEAHTPRPSARTFQWMLRSVSARWPMGVEREVRVYKKVLCDVCEGTGAEGKAVKPCTTCGGSRKVQKVARSLFGSFTQVGVCPQCQGKGSVPKVNCKKCGGDGVVREYQTLTVHIPGGIDDQQSLRLSGYGEMPAGGGRAGDLYVTIHVKPHPHFGRKGNNVHSKTEIAFSQAALGDKVDIETIDGPITIKFAAGTRSGTLLKIKGRGISKLGGFSRGDHFRRNNSENSGACQSGTKETDRAAQG